MSLHEVSKIVKLIRKESKIVVARELGDTGWRIRNHEGQSRGQAQGPGVKEAWV